MTEPWRMAGAGGRRREARSKSVPSHKREIATKPAEKQADRIETILQACAQRRPSAQVEGSTRNRECGSSVCGSERHSFHYRRGDCSRLIGQSEFIVRSIAEEYRNV